MDQEDPIVQFFPDQDTVDLYEVLSVTSDAKTDAIKKAYRRLALVHHPDKHATASDMDKAAASIKFQQVGFAYAVLGDETRRLRYDQTGRTDEGFELAAGDDGWEAYFEAMFERVTRGKLDEIKKEYQGSSEEIEDLAAAYTSTGGSIGEIMNHIPHSTNEDEARFIVIISDLIAKGTLPMLDNWDNSVSDENAKLFRRKQGEKEAEEAERLAQELGVWDEFYGRGKKGKWKTEGKGKKRKDGKDDEEDHSVLQTLILKKQQKNMDSFFDGLAAKYTEPTSKARGQAKKRGRAVNEAEGEGLPTKKIRKGAPQPPDIDDEEFEKLQASLFGTKAKLPSSTFESQEKTETKTRRKAK
ncbi:hypothetical protein C0989_011547 [Termitomyces sp. Mn162]|nr:hypothetical protein C0989_011547 [Termitomyces sp. Mn162]